MFRFFIQNPEYLMYLKNKKKLQLTLAIIQSSILLITSKTAKISYIKEMATKTCTIQKNLKKLLTVKDQLTSLKDLFNGLIETKPNVDSKSIK